MCFTAKSTFTKVSVTITFNILIKKEKVCRYRNNLRKKSTNTDW